MATKSTATKKRTMTKAQRAKLSAAARDLWAKRRAAQAGTKVPYEATNAKETPEAGLRRTANELLEVQRTNDHLQGEVDELEDLISREYRYHALRAEELLLELHRRGITP